MIKPPATEKKEILQEDRQEETGWMARKDLMLILSYKTWVKGVCAHTAN